LRQKIELAFIPEALHQFVDFPHFLPPTSTNLFSLRFPLFLGSFGICHINVLKSFSCLFSDQGEYAEF
jgi:hypothetical protein